jgi:hypothetical protein
MATTTNYGWTTPDDTALVKDGAAAIRTLGSSVDTTTKALNPSTTLGDIEYRSSTANTNTRLGIGSTGNILTVVGGVPAWAAPSGGGKVLQVVSTTYSTATTVASTTYGDTGLSLSITPSSATSKVLVLITQSLYATRQEQAAGGSVRLMRGATSVYEANGTDDAGALYIRATTSSAQSQLTSLAGITFLDSPATTSSTTYKTQIKSQNVLNSASVMAQAQGATSTIILMEIGA